MLFTGEGGQKTGMLQDMQAVYKEGGIRGLYRGLGPQLLAAVPATCGMYAGERFFSHLFEKADGMMGIVSLRACYAYEEWVGCGQAGWQPRHDNPQL